MLNEFLLKYRMHHMLIVCVAIIFVSSKRVSYHGHKVYRLNVTNQQSVNSLRQLVDNPYIDFWSFPNVNGVATDVRVHPKFQAKFLQILQLNGILNEVIIENVASTIGKKRLLQSSAEDEGISFTKYHRFKTIENYLKRLVKDFPSNTSLISIGKSFENRILNVIHISSDPEANKPVVFIDAGIHSREWIAPAVALYIIHQLVENPANSYLMNEVDWHILPVLNPDGYEYTHTADRMWRKSRSSHPHQGRCIGTDLNRNFNFHWNESSTSPNSCSDIYPGPFPLSENETISLTEHFNKWKHRIRLYLSFHSYGNYILHPWAYTSSVPSDYFKLNNLGNTVKQAIKKFSGGNYLVGSPSQLLYAASGSSMDWTKGVTGIELSYALELRGGGKYGFDPEPELIIPIATETFVGVKVFGEYIAQKFGH